MDPALVHLMLGTFLPVIYMFLLRNVPLVVIILLKWIWSNTMKLYLPVILRPLNCTNSWRFCCIQIMVYCFVFTDFSQYPFRWFILPITCCLPLKKKCFERAGSCWPFLLEDKTWTLKDTILNLFYSHGSFECYLPSVFGVVWNMFFGWSPNRTLLGTTAMQSDWALERCWNSSVENNPISYLNCWTLPRLSGLLIKDLVRLSFTLLRVSPEWLVLQSLILLGVSDVMGVRDVCGASSTTNQHSVWQIPST